ncbi:MAG TPA: DUF4388 domain-containing protein [Pyrinomonadaceae bacterium]|nr:DUF4388 domain-containing protein [Pyrinomonadaceae bacterium]
MALTGQLSDMSLAELIEFFCNQRKTGRLKIDYPRGHSVFFIKDGELVDARVGALSGAEAVYFSLTLPNAAFDFSPEVLPQHRTINVPWTQVVLEGLRRLDEGQSPTEADAFGAWSPNDSDMVAMLDHVERLGEKAPQKAAAREAEKEEDEGRAVPAAEPLSMMVEGAGDSGGRRKWVLVGVAACVLLACAVAAIPLSGRMGRKPAAAPKQESTQAAPQPAPAPEEAGAPATTAEAVTEAAQPGAEGEAAAATAAAEARRERERRERERRERERREEEKKSESAEAAKPAPTPAAGPKLVRVAVSYDESGRVTQASVAGASPGAEAYGSTAVRVARGKRFPTGKAGTTVITIPVN